MVGMEPRIERAHGVSIQGVHMNKVLVIGVGSVRTRVLRHLADIGVESVGASRHPARGLRR